MDELQPAAATATAATGPDRRTAVRKPCAFDVSWQGPDGRELRGAGFEISAGGLVFALPVKNAPAELAIAAVIRKAAISLTVAPLRTSPMQMQDQYWTKFACRIVAVDEAAWAKVLAAVPDRVAPQMIPAAVEALLAPKKTENPQVHPDVQQRIVSFLIARDQLDPAPDGRPPAAAIVPAGEAKTADGRLFRRYKVDAVRSRLGAQEKYSALVVLAVETGTLTLVGDKGA